MNLPVSRQNAEITTQSQPIATHSDYIVSIAPNTAKAIQAALNSFFNAGQNIDNLTDATLAAYVQHSIDAGLSINTIKTRVALLRKFSQDALGITIPVKGSIHGLKIKAYSRSKNQSAGRGQANGLSDVDVMAAIKAIDTDQLTGKRDAALLYFSMVTAGRVSETISYKVKDIDEARKVILLRSSKTDQEGQGTYKHLSNNLLTLLKDYIATAGLSGEDVIFNLSARHINRIIKQHLGDGYSSHSFRVGFIETAIQRGLTESSIMLTTKHKTSRMVAHYGQKSNQANSAAASMFS